MKYHLLARIIMSRKEVLSMFEVISTTHSPLYPLMQDYINERELKSLDSRSVKAVLKNFERYSVRVGYREKRITREHFHGWLDSIEGSEEHKILYARGLTLFARHLSTIGHESYIATPPRYKSNFVPYIYTQDEIDRLFRAADSWRDRNMTPDSTALVMPALLRLLYSTAIRIGEALNITNADVDFQRHVIRLIRTKNMRDRFCAMNPSLEDVIKEYVHYRDMLPIEGVSAPQAPLFCNKRGGPIRQAAITNRFHDLQRAIGMAATSSGYLPRIHDIRHSACVMAMRKLTATGKDIYYCMPQLAAYMGHCNPFDTEYYLRLTPTAFPELLEMTSYVTQPIEKIISQYLRKKEE